MKTLRFHVLLFTFYKIKLATNCMLFYDCFLLQSSVFVILPPPPPVSSNNFHVSGCKSTSASPARVSRHETLPARTRSLNLPGSEQEGIFIQFENSSIIV